MIDYIDKEEKEMIESLHSEDWISDFNDEIKKQYEEYALFSLTNSKEIKVNISERDFELISTKAMQAGIPCEALVSILIHKYNQSNYSLNL